MVRIRIVGDKIELISVEQAEAIYWKDCEDRWDWHSFERVTEVAEKLSASTGKLYIPIDKGDSVSPRYDVIEAPAIGDKVSYYFNGDSYPCGEIVSISKTMKKITTSEGNTFYRRRNSGSWIMNGTWTLINGHVYQQNPHF